MVTTTVWNPNAHEDYDKLKGLQVYTSDDEKLGTIEQVFHPQSEMPEARGNHYFLVKPGAWKELLGGDEVYVPESAISAVSEERAVLTFSKDQLKEQGWSTPPADLDRMRRG